MPLKTLDYRALMFQGKHAAKASQPGLSRESILKEANRGSDTILQPKAQLKAAFSLPFPIFSGLLYHVRFFRKRESASPVPEREQKGNSVEKNRRITGR